MGYPRTMGAGLAGSTNKIYGNANVNQVQYGDKLQGLPPVTGRRDPYRVYKSKAGGNAPDRFRVFCINQLGGIGMGNKNSQFAPNADGLGWCPNRKNSVVGRTGIHDHDHAGSSVRHHSRGNSQYHDLHVTTKPDNSALFMTNFLVNSLPPTPNVECPKIQNETSNGKFEIKRPRWVNSGIDKENREWFLVITIPGNNESNYQKTSYGEKPFPGRITDKRIESLFKDIPFNDSIEEDSRKDVLKKEKRYEGLAYLYIDDEMKDFKFINPYGKGYNHDNKYNPDKCHLWSEHNPMSQVMNMAKESSYGIFWNDALAPFVKNYNPDTAPKLKTSHSKGAFFIKHHHAPENMSAIIISSSFPYEPCIASYELTKVPIIGIRSKKLDMDKNIHPFSNNIAFSQHFYANIIYGKESINNFLDVIKIINPGDKSIDVFSNYSEMSCEDLRKRITSDTEKGYADFIANSKMKIDVKVKNENKMSIHTKPSTIPYYLIKDSPLNSDIMNAYNELSKYQCIPWTFIMDNELKDIKCLTWNGGPSLSDPHTHMATKFNLNKCCYYNDSNNKSIETVRGINFINTEDSNNELVMTNYNGRIHCKLGLGDNCVIVGSLNNQGYRKDSNCSSKDACASSQRVRGGEFYINKNINLINAFRNIFYTSNHYNKNEFIQSQGCWHSSPYQSERLPSFPPYYPLHWGPPPDLFENLQYPMKTSSKLLHDLTPKGLGIVTEDLLNWIKERIDSDYNYTETLKPSVLTYSDTVSSPSKQVTLTNLQVEPGNDMYTHQASMSDNQITWKKMTQYSRYYLIVFSNYGVNDYNDEYFQLIFYSSGVKFESGKKNQNPVAAFASYKELMSHSGYKTTYKSDDFNLTSNNTQSGLLFNIAEENMAESMGIEYYQTIE